jgi:hypothetical protein
VVPDRPKGHTCGVRRGRRALTRGSPTGRRVGDAPASRPDASAFVLPFALMVFRFARLCGLGSALNGAVSLRPAKHLRAIALRPLALLALAAAVPMLPAGCSTPGTAPSQPSGDTLGALPDDLTVDLTVLPGADLRTRSEAHIVRSKYILFPDGSLQGDRGRSIDVLTRPARIRTLSRDAMADLWLLLGQTGFTELGETGFSGNAALLAPAPAEVLTVLTVHANGVTGTFIRRAAPDAADPATTRVVRAIARLAWATDDPPLEATVQPIRYDLGADPYARYRSTGGASTGSAASPTTQRP